jgi:DNA modification methylase
MQGMRIRDRIRELRRVPAGELLPHAKNWRRHPPAQAAALRGLLKELGYAAALIARETAEGKLELIDGHLRAETTPDSVVPVLVVDLSEAEADKLLLTLDSLTGMAGADASRVAELLSTVGTDNEAVAGLLERIAVTAGCHGLISGGAPEPEIDRAAELQVKWATAPGQLWEIGLHQLLCADCRAETDVMRLWPEGSPKLRMVWTDPPYGVDYAAKSRYLNHSDRGNRIQKPIINDKPAEAHATFAGALELARGRALVGASCYVAVPSGPQLSGFIEALNQSGFTFRQLLIWVKQQFVIGMNDYHYRHESVLYGRLANGARYWAGGRSQDTVFEIDRPHTSPMHPTTKPVELVTRMIVNSSQAGDIVYDPFCGSGTTLVACEQLRRRGYAVEIDPGYVAVALERLAAMGLCPMLVN